MTKVYETAGVINTNTAIKLVAEPTRPVIAAGEDFVASLAHRSCS
jgi:hypothetical protein